MLTRLSICIATFKRSQFIGETLDSILNQIEPGVEVVVVDGASPDNTADVVGHYVQRYPQIRYFRESHNSGVDADFDKAVGYACGEYCWLMTDDDLLKQGAVKKVLSFLDGESELIVVNSEIRNTDMTQIFEGRCLKFDFDKMYEGKDRTSFFADLAAYLSFIGCVIIRRDYWLKRDRSSYFGSLFVHAGVIFQNPPITRVVAIAEPLIAIRYGNAMWTSRSFEVWMFKWPQLIWSTPNIPDVAMRMICRREPWRSAKTLFHNRALGAYSLAEFRKFWPISVGGATYAKGYFLSIFPSSLANPIMVLYFSMLKPINKMAIHDLLYSRSANGVSRLVARIFGTSY